MFHHSKTGDAQEVLCCNGWQQSTDCNDGIFGLLGRPHIDSLFCCQQCVSHVLQLVCWHPIGGLLAANLKAPQKLACGNANWCCLFWQAHQEQEETGSVKALSSTEAGIELCWDLEQHWLELLKMVPSNRRKKQWRRRTFDCVAMKEVTSTKASTKREVGPHGVTQQEQPILHFPLRNQHHPIWKKAAHSKS